MKLLITLMTLSLLVGCAGTAPTLGLVDGQLQPCPDSPNCVVSGSNSADHKY